jgi:hypothetical protein
VASSVTGLGITELRGFIPVEIFRSEKVGAGKYSIRMRAKLQSSERTLRDERGGPVGWADCEGDGRTRRRAEGVGADWLTVPSRDNRPICRARLQAGCAGKIFANFAYAPAEDRAI